MGRGDSAHQNEIVGGRGESPTAADVMLIIGPPGAGKGTLSPLIANKHQAQHISTGDIFREAIAAGTEVGKLASSLINDGNLVPDDVVVRIIEEAMPPGSVLLDGFPRTLPQAIELDKMLKNRGRSITHVFWCDAPDEILESRIVDRLVCTACGYPGSSADSACSRCEAKLSKRDDDTAESLAKRLHVYHAETEPIIHSHYSDVIRIDSAASREVVRNSIQSD